MLRINYFTSPNFSKNLWGSANRTVANGELTVNPDGGDYCAITIITPKDVGQLTLSVDVMGSGNVQVFDTGWKFLANTGGFSNIADWTRKNIRFTPPDGKNFMICFYHGSAPALKVRHPQLEPTSTFDAAVRDGLPVFFDGDTAPY